MTRSRVKARAGQVLPPALVASQFEALEALAGEPAVPTLPAQVPPAEQVRAVLRWLEESNLHRETTA